MILNSYRFAGGGVTLPLMWWDLDDDGTWANQGTAGSVWDLNEVGTVTTTSSTIGTTSRTVADFDNALGTKYLEYDNAGTKTVAWGGADDISVAIWLKAESVSSALRVMINWRGGATSPNDRLFVLQLQDVAGTDEDIQGAIWDGASVLSNNVNSDNLFAHSTWYHVVMTFDNATNTNNLYLDGNPTPIATATTALGALPTVAAPFAIGAQANTKTTNGWDGQMAMAGIWDVALTTDEIATLYNGGEGAPYSEIWT